MRKAAFIALALAGFVAAPAFADAPKEIGRAHV